MASKDKGRPELSVIKKAVLRLVQGLVSKSIYRGIEIIMSPCCKVYFTNYDISCDPDNPGNYIVTVTINTPLYLLNKGVVQLGVGSYQSKHIDYVDGSTTLTFTNVVADPSDTHLSVVAFMGLFPEGDVNFTSITYRISSDVSPIPDPVFPTCP